MIKYSVTKNNKNRKYFNSIRIFKINSALILFIIEVFYIYIIQFLNHFQNKNSYYGQKDREKWVELAYKISYPVLNYMSRGILHKKMITEYSDKFSSDKNVLFLECFGRLMDGISAWLSLPDDNSKEGKIRKKLRDLALLSYKNAVDPNNPDKVIWYSTKTKQPLVDAAFLAESFLRAPGLWNQLDNITKKRYIENFKKTRKIKPSLNNWILFSGIIECFFIQIGEEPDIKKMFKITKQINEWYIGDGWYSDGKYFAMNYYNSYVIHPMFIQMLEIMEKSQIKVPVSSKIAVQRMQKYNLFLERLITPEGKFPAFGRSIVYRLAVFQTLSLSIWKYGLPKPLSNGGVRNALTKVILNMFKNKGNFNKKGFLSLGFSGHQPNVANIYCNNGSAYITSFIFLALGNLPNSKFWTEASKEWTSKKAWEGKPFPIANHIKRII